MSNDAALTILAYGFFFGFVAGTAFGIFMPMWVNRHYQDRDAEMIRSQRAIIAEQEAVIHYLENKCDYYESHLESEPTPKPPAPKPQAIDRG